MKFRYFIKLWTDSALEARAPLCNCLVGGGTWEHSARRGRCLGLTGGGRSPLWSSGKVSLLHCQLYLQFAVSRLCFYTVVEFHLCVAPCLFHCRYKKWLLPHGRVNVSHVDPMLRVSQKHLSNSRGWTCSEQEGTQVNSLRLWILLVEDLSVCSGSNKYTKDIYSVCSCFPLQ